jgi:hypothetical protein
MGQSLAKRARIMHAIPLPVVYSLSLPSVSVLSVSGV